MLMTLLLSLMLMAGLFLMLFAGVVFIQDKRLFTSAPKDVWQAIKPHPETEGCAGFHSFGYNWKDHLKTAAACVLASLILSGICVL